MSDAPPRVNTRDTRAATPVPMLAVSPTYESVVLSCLYNTTAWNGMAPGLGWVRMFDNPVMAWLIDGNNAYPPQPVIIGTQPPVAPATAPVLSPNWASITKYHVFVPDMWRGTATDYFDFITTNNGAQRKIYCDFTDPLLTSAYANWAARNPQLVLADNPTLAF